MALSKNQLLAARYAAGILRNIQPAMTKAKPPRSGIAAIRIIYWMMLGSGWKRTQLADIRRALRLWKSRETRRIASRYLYETSNQDHAIEESIPGKGRNGAAQDIERILKKYGISPLPPARTS